MKITVLDGYALNPGDNPWTAVEALGDLTVYDRTPPELLLERAQGADILLTNKTVLSKDAIHALPDLKFISVLATGYNIVDTAAAAEYADYNHQNDGQNRLKNLNQAFHIHNLSYWISDRSISASHIHAFLHIKSGSLCCRFS